MVQQIVVVLIVVFLAVSLALQERGYNKLR